MAQIVDNFMKVLSDQPLSLALCAMNLLLLWFLFKQNTQFSQARTETSQMIVAWQKESQAIMADCVSKEVMEMVLAALERDRATYRAMLPSYTQPDGISSHSG